MSSELAPIAVANLDPHRFRRACARFATGVAIVTLLDREGAPHGMTVNSFTSVSLGPPLFLVCIDHRASIVSNFRKGRALAINVLRAEQRDLSVRFARPGASRFHLADWQPGVTGAPLIPGVLATLEGKISNTVEAGDHLIVVAEAFSATASAGRPLVYFESKYQTVGGLP
jgi:flavin reductase (DIM6/NTAB) family NADH-FMN oxidoreductase RutF